MPCCPDISGLLCNSLMVLHSASTSCTQRGSSGHAAGDVPCPLTCPELWSSCCPSPLHSALRERALHLVVIRADLMEQQWQEEVVVRHQPDGMPSSTRIANQPNVCFSLGYPQSYDSHSSGFCLLFHQSLHFTLGKYFFFFKSSFSYFQ